MRQRFAAISQRKSCLLQRAQFQLLVPMIPSVAWVITNHRPLPTSYFYIINVRTGGVVAQRVQRPCRTKPQLLECALTSLKVDLQLVDKLLLPAPIEVLRRRVFYVKTTQRPPEAMNIITPKYTFVPANNLPAPGSHHPESQGMFW